MRSLLFFITHLFRYRSQLFLGLLLSLILSLSSIALLSLSGWFISSAAFAGLSLVAATNFNYFIPAASIRFLALTRILSRYFDRVVNHDYTFRILAGLRVWFYQQLIPLSPAYLLKARSGELLNRMVNDIDMLDHLYLNTLSPLLITIMTTLIAFIFMLHFSIKISLIMLSMIVLTLVVVSSITVFNSLKIGAAIQQSTALFRTHCIDFFQRFSDFLLFVKKEKRLDAIHDAAEQLACAQKKLAITKGFAISAMQFFSGLTVFILLYIGIPLVNHGHLNGAILAMFILLGIAVFEQLALLPLAFLSLGKTMQAADRLKEITTQKPAVIFSKDAQHNLQLQNNIEIRNLSFAYPNTTKLILNNMSLSIPFRSQLGITGPSGSGKTTLAYLLTRIYDPTQGNILIDNHSLKNLSENTLRNTISFVRQRVHIFSASIRDNLTVFSNAISDDACFSVLEKMELADVVHALPDGLNTWMGEFGNHFSGGQIRRIAIARALLANTPILILDEPSTGLEKKLMERIWKNCENDFKNKTLIAVTHDAQVLEMMSKCLQL